MSNSKNTQEGVKECEQSIFEITQRKSAEKSM